MTLDSFSYVFVVIILGRSGITNISHVLPTLADNSAFKTWRTYIGDVLGDHEYIIDCARLLCLHASMQ